MHSHILVHVHNKFDQYPTSSVGATVVNGQIDGRTDSQTCDQTSVTFPKCSQFGTGTQKSSLLVKESGDTKSYWKQTYL